MVFNCFISYDKQCYPTKRSHFINLGAMRSNLVIIVFFLYKYDFITDVLCDDSKRSNMGNWLKQYG